MNCTLLRPHCSHRSNSCTSRSSTVCRRRSGSGSSMMISSSVSCSSRRRLNCHLQPLLRPCLRGRRPFPNSPQRSILNIPLGTSICSLTRCQPNMLQLHPLSAPKRLLGRQSCHSRIPMHPAPCCHRGDPSRTTSCLRWTVATWLVRLMAQSCPAAPIRQLRRPSRGSLHPVAPPISPAMLQVTSLVRSRRRGSPYRNCNRHCRPLT